MVHRYGLLTFDAGLIRGLEFITGGTGINNPNLISHHSCAKTRNPENPEGRNLLRKAFFYLESLKHPPGKRQADF